VETTPAGAFLFSHFCKKMKGWVRGYCVSTVGLVEQQIRQLIKEQEKLQKQQLEFDFD
jgi:REP element-mobilizing transposase RayT